MAARRHRGREHQVEEPCLTGAGEEEAQRLWDALDRSARARLRAEALQAGVRSAPNPRTPRTDEDL